MLGVSCIEYSLNQLNVQLGLAENKTQFQTFGNDGARNIITFPLGLSRVENAMFPSGINSKSIWRDHIASFYLFQRMKGRKHQFQM